MKTNIIVGCITLLIVLSSSQIFHRIKTSISEIFIKNNIIRIRIKLFTEDLSSMLHQTINQHIAGELTDLNSEVLEHLHTYIRSNFSIAINDDIVRYSFKHFSTEHHSSAQTKKIWLIYEYTHTDKIKTFELKNTLLFDGLQKQKNKCRITLNEKETQTHVFQKHKTELVKKIQF